VKNYKVSITNGFGKFCSHNKFCSGTLYVPEQEIKHSKSSRYCIVT